MRTAGLVVLVAVAACAGARATQSPAPQSSAAPAATAAGDSFSAERAQYPSTYKRHPYAAVLIKNATIMTAAGQEILNGSILFKDGRIVAVGASVTAPADAVVVDGTGKYVTPGIIDVHSHIGVYAEPGTWAESDGNEATRAPTPRTYGPSTRSGRRTPRSRWPSRAASPPSKPFRAPPT